MDVHGPRSTPVPAAPAGLNGWSGSSWRRCSGHRHGQEGSSHPLLAPVPLDSGWSLNQVPGCLVTSQLWAVGSNSDGFFKVQH